MTAEPLAPAGDRQPLALAIDFVVHAGGRLGGPAHTTRGENVCLSTPLPSSMFTLNPQQSLLSSHVPYLPRRCGAARR